ncbi:hypothetical protein M2475_000533 [Breznakia sp. PF5-3]|uniref:hypothetical protein n=1 Tax=unclassified Breznakia TaxID=2623764 RepID=UPI002405AE17|nr:MULTISPECIES: hypothetical protein [unclassified Breznakia]MDF9824183.1 hypothetical protein [Breznakia sp. PM6-1]MDF9834981.1 hypothetical protein [Breznakia sp. PF5-3]MDF9837150.1 hypothetical protein [Breznakia sp. PFB2-8]MDF9859140.1 hypothetical protein [Breznakia sp. PH5-24]
MSEKDFNELLEEKVERLENAVEKAADKVDTVITSVEDTNKETLVKIGTMAVGASLMATYVPLRKKHPILAKTSFLIGATAVGIGAIQLLNEYIKE